MVKKIYILFALIGMVMLMGNVSAYKVFNFSNYSVAIAGNVTIDNGNWYNGLFNLYINADESASYLSFNGSTVTFSEAQLNATIQSHISDTNIIYNASDVWLTVGTYDSGDLESIRALGDSNEYNITEVSGTPGFTIYTNFSNITAFNVLALRGKYSGGAGHTVEIELYRVGVGWEERDEVTDQMDYGVTTVDIFVGEDFIDANNVVQARVNHDDSGNINHAYSLDYIVIGQSAGVIAGGSLGGLSGRDEACALLPTLLCADGSANITGDMSINNTLYVSGGKVGIGTATPAFDSGNLGLHISDATSPALRLTDSNNANSDFELYSPDGINDLIMHHVNTDQNLTTWRSGSFIINEDSQDIDFRVVSDVDDYSLFVQGSDGYVGIGTAAPAVELHIYDGTAGDGAGLKIQSDSAQNALNMYAMSPTYAGIPEWAGNGLIESAYGNLLIGTYLPQNNITFYSRDGVTITPTMQIMGTGNVGIGTTAPKKNLHIQGNPNPGIALTETDDANGNFTIDVNGGNLYIRSWVDDFVTQVIRFAVDGNTGFVGIGTNAPQDDLHIVDTSASISISANGNDANIFMSEDNGFNPFISGMNIHYDGGDNQLQFITTQSGINITTMAIDTASPYEIGIGTNNPQNDLHISDGEITSITNTGGGGMIISNAVSSRVYLEDTGEGANDKLMVLSAQDENMYIGSMNDLGTAWDTQYILVANRDGDVGIGDATPSYDLDVTGDIRATDDVFVNDDITVSGCVIGQEWSAHINSGVDGDTLAGYMSAISPCTVNCLSCVDYGGTARTCAYSGADIHCQYELAA